MIYYINFEGRSQLYLMVKDKFKAKEKVKVTGGGASLSNIIKSNILSLEDNNNTKNINLIVDENDSQELMVEESKHLYQIFRDASQFLSIPQF